MGCGCSGQSRDFKRTVQKAKQDQQALSQPKPMTRSERIEARRIRIAAREVRMAERNANIKAARMTIQSNVQNESTSS
jgi:hypothetical protein